MAEGEVGADGEEEAGSAEEEEEAQQGGLLCSQWGIIVDGNNIYVI